MSIPQWLLVAGGLMIVGAAAGGLVITRPGSRAARNDPAAVRAQRLMLSGAVCFAAAVLLLTAALVGPPGWQLALVLVEGVAAVVGLALLLIGAVRLYRHRTRTAAGVGPSR